MRYKAILETVLVGLLAAGMAHAASLSEIDLSAPVASPMSGHLKVGGANPQGVMIDANSRYLTLGGKPWLPVMGEFHFSRYPHDQWEEELLKMKAGGINIVSAYIFWIHHEEVEGQFDWSGDKDLRQFVQLCNKVGLYCFLRLGPWDHGEARNGGFPDWLLAKVPARQIRTTDPAFMGYTRGLYSEIFKQVKGLLYKDGGPIIGIQVENELRNNAPYLLALKNMAKEIGFDVPLYSMTGWGPARVPENELLPMFGGYTDGFWIDGTQVSYSSTVQFFFTHSPNDERLRKNAPLVPSAAMAYLQRYPFLTCEIGGGMAISYVRRPLIPWRDVASAALCKLGDGSCLMGYYMYHGGGNPPGKLSTLQESQATNYPNDMPVIDYDFQAPLGQFGQVRPSYNALRLLHTFIADFGGDLCTMPSTLPKVVPTDLDDPNTLRWAARSDGHRGFIFINNHQRGVNLPEKQAQFLLHLADGDQAVPDSPVTIPSDAFMIWPFNLDLNGSLLRYSTAQLLCRVDDGGVPCFVFFAPNGVEPSFAMDSKTTASAEAADGTLNKADNNGVTLLSGLTPGKGMVTIKSSAGRPAHILLLTQDQAMHAWKANLWGQDRLAISSGDLIFDGPELRVQSEDPQASVWIYPAPTGSVTADRRSLPGEKKFPFSQYTCQATPVPVPVQISKLADAGPVRTLALGSKHKPLPPEDADYANAASWHISVPAETSANVHKVYLQLDYTGDVARAYVGDRFIDDDFYYGRPWEIGLNRYAPQVYHQGITLKVLPVPAGAAIYIPNGTPQPEPMPQGADLRGATAHVQYEWRLQCSN